MVTVVSNTHDPVLRNPSNKHFLFASFVAVKREAKEKKPDSSAHALFWLHTRMLSPSPAFARTKFFPSFGRIISAPAKFTAFPPFLVLHASPSLPSRIDCTHPPSAGSSFPFLSLLLSRDNTVAISSGHCIAISPALNQFEFKLKLFSHFFSLLFMNQKLQLKLQTVN